MFLRLQISRGLVNPWAWPVKLLFTIVHAGFSASFFMLFLLSVEVYIVTRYRLTAHLKLTKKKETMGYNFSVVGCNIFRF